MDKVLIGIDPGVHMGVAVTVDGKLVELTTSNPWHINNTIVLMRMKHSAQNIATGYIEDSNLQSNVFTAPALSSSAVKLKIARNIGEIDAYCKIIKAFCKSRDIECVSVSPKAKGKKLNASEFKRITGWTGRSNQHERDAAMLIWGR